MNTDIKSKIDIVFIYLFSSHKSMVFDIYKPYFNNKFINFANYKHGVNKYSNSLIINY